MHKSVLKTCVTLIKKVIIVVISNQVVTEYVLTTNEINKFVFL